MKTVRKGAMVFAFISLVGGYLLHQYFWFSGPEASAKWNELVLPLTLGLGWILLIAAAVLAFTRPDEADR
jgi:hypothetical protein